MATDFYELLGVSRQVGEDELKKAYRRLARQYHPDANGGDPEAEARFKEITVAYETLRDPEKRRRYDLYGADGAAGGAGPGPGFGDFGVSDLFDAFFGFSGGQRGPAGPGRGPDAEVRVEIDLEESVFGITRDVELRMPLECKRCSGSGCEPGTHPSTCRACAGEGQVRQVRRTILGQMVTALPCGTCGGSGREILSPCQDCRGEGRVNQDTTLEVQIPAGIADGQRLRLSGRGPAASRGGAPGDLYVSVSVRRHARFQRHGDDLVQVLGIPMTQAVLGAVLPIETLDGEEDLVIPAGTQSGRVFRLRGRGVPSLRGRGRGDLLVQVDVAVPEKLSVEEAALMRRLAELRGEEVAPKEEGFFSRIRSAFQ
ncbi:MAG: molecular chaperone DnaJ [Acidimicrobiia bacterium]